MKRKAVRPQRRPGKGVRARAGGRAAAEGGAAKAARRRRSAAPPAEAALLARAARVRLLLFDVDGVLTDGRIWFGPQGEAMKAFDVRDGHGIVLVRDQVQLGVISGRPGTATEARLRDLRFQHLIFGQRDKLAGYATLAHLGIPDDEVAYMGDDVNDIPLLRKVGLSAAPADALPEVRAAVHFVAAARGGRGAVRELCDLIRRAKGGPPPA